MNSFRAQIETIAQELRDLCGNISVRDDDQGAFILAFGLKDVHSLELRQIGDKFEVELWHGKTAEVEYVVDKLRLNTAREAIECARQWLNHDTV